MRHRSRSSIDSRGAPRRVRILGDIARMLISPEQGDFLTLLTKSSTSEPRSRSAPSPVTVSSVSRARLGQWRPPSPLRCQCGMDRHRPAYWKRTRREPHRLLIRPRETGVNWLVPRASLDLAFIEPDKPGSDAYSEILLTGRNRMASLFSITWSGAGVSSNNHQPIPMVSRSSAESKPSSDPRARVSPAARRGRVGSRAQTSGRRKLETTKTRNL